MKCLLKGEKEEHTNYINGFFKKKKKKVSPLCKSGSTGPWTNI